MSKRTSWCARIPLDTQAGLPARVPANADAPASLSSRVQLDARLDCLAGMLSPWLEKLRHPAQFWPQFDALAQQILDLADAGDRAHVQQRLDAMLTAHALPPRAIHGQAPRTRHH